MTHRQYASWEVWESESLNHPDRLEYYLAQCCSEIRRVMSTNPSSINTGDFILKFKEKREPTEEEKKVFSAGAKSMWAGRMSMPIRIITPEEATYIYAPGHPKYKGE